MFNYRLTFNADFTETMNKVNETFQTTAKRAVAVGAEMKDLSEKLDKAISEKNADEAASIQKERDKKAEAWKVERKKYDTILFGNKKDNVGGLCDGITNDFYKSYKDFVVSANVAPFKQTVADFLQKSSVEDEVRARAIDEFTTALLCKVGGRFASNKKIVDGEDYVQAVNKKAFKRVLFGSILDIVNHSTIKTEVPTVEADDTAEVVEA